MENTKQKKTFRIGELSKLFGISTDAIRYYEKVGILKPKRNAENNYRYYTLDDVRKMLTIRELLSLDFSTDQIRQFQENRSIEKTQQMLKEELSVVNAELVSLFEKKYNIETRISAIAKSLSLKADETVRCLNFEARDCLMISATNLPDDYVDYFVTRYAHLHQNRIDTIGACDCYTLDLAGSNPDSLYYRTKNIFFFSQNQLYQANYTLPEGRYLSLVYRGPLTRTKELMPRLFEYAKAHHLKIMGDPIEMCRLDEYETDHDEEFITELELPVQ
ncbi:MerR family transcriptional regulator [Pseudoramibacter sp.]|jgi:DNA-binding transcriptional MerR regulator/effector-binding domain-containing protein|uniref:MerR family transcriptional regulator n=1 Tax=Pseudoramibacter sp. TaxID=2034862 RepID=UPI0025F7E32C|nr:MerR family transcriptional regulator [Pseudoramibacter sp.]MCH4072289.1 MerR family transcriptional regulator [Pseudoramibacter sp.]MCH4106060.1 MerR family transcriptional regulator [Pseudoramibacter sp.]